MRAVAQAKPSDGASGRQALRCELMLWCALVVSAAGCGRYGFAAPAAGGGAVDAGEAGATLPSDPELGGSTTEAGSESFADDAALPSSLDAAAEDAAVDAGLGGMTDGTPFIIYDVSTDSWSTGPAMGAPKMWATAQVYDGQLHVLGGLDAASSEILDHDVLTP